MKHTTAIYNLSSTFFVTGIVVFIGCVGESPSPAGNAAAGDSQKSKGKADLPVGRASPASRSWRKVSRRADVVIVEKNLKLQLDDKTVVPHGDLQPGSTLEVETDEGSRIRVRKGDVTGWVECSSVAPVDVAWSIVADRIKREPADKVWLAARGSIHAILGHLSFAERDFQDAIKADLATASVHARLASALFNQDRYAEAIQEYNTAISLDASIGKNYVDRATARSQMDDIDGAMEDLQSALACKDYRTESYTSRAILHLKRKAYRDAVADCDTALEINPAIAQLYFLRAQAKLNLDKRKDALADLAIGGRSGPGYFLSECDKFVNTVKQDLESNPSNVDTLVTLGFINDKAGATAEARELVAKALALQKVCPLGWLLKGLIHHRLDEHADAISAFDQAEQQGIVWSVMFLHRGQSHRALENIEAAARDLEHSIQLDPSRYDSWNERVVTLEQAGQLDKATIVADMAVLVGGGSEAAFRTRGRFRLNRGQIAGALDDADTALGFWSFSEAAQTLRLEATAHRMKIDLQPDAADDKFSRLRDKLNRIIEHLENSTYYSVIREVRDDSILKGMEQLRRFAPPPRINVNAVRSEDLERWYRKVANLKSNQDEADFNLAHFPLQMNLDFEVGVEQVMLDTVKAVLKPDEYELAVRHLSLKDRLQLPLVYTSLYRNDFQLNRARRLLNQLLAANPEDPLLLTFQGDLYRALLEVEPAIRAYDRVIAKSPEFKPALLGRAFARLRLGELRLAAEDFNRYSELNGTVVGSGADHMEQKRRRVKLRNYVNAAKKTDAAGNQELIFAEFDQPPPVVLIERQDGSMRTSLNSISQYEDFVLKNKRDVIGAVSLKLMAEDILREAGSANEQFFHRDLALAKELVELRQRTRKRP